MPQRLDGARNRFRHSGGSIAAHVVDAAIGLGVGALAFLINIGVYALCLKALGLTPILSAIAAFGVVVMSNYLWNRWRAGRDQRNTVTSQAIGFFLTAIGALAINVLLLHALLSSDFAPVSAQFVAVAIVAPMSFLTRLSRERLSNVGAASPPASIDAPAATRTHLPRRLAFFVVVGISCLLLQLLLLKTLRAQGLGLFAADAVGFLVSAQINFLLSDRLTWGDSARVHGRARARRWLTFNLVVMLSTVVNAVVFTGLQPRSDDLTALLAAAGASAVFTFLMNHRVVFRLSAPDPSEDRSRFSFDSIAWFLPAYSEAKNLPVLVPEIVSYMQSLGCRFDVIIVDDGSQDDTGDVAEGLANTYPEVKVVHHEVNRGYGAALRTGLQAGLQTGQSLVGFCDADLQFRIHSLGPMLEAIMEADLVLGYREKRADSLKRRFMGRGWHHLSSLALGFNARDTDCGFKLFRREVVENLVPRLHGEYATISPELIARAQQKGFHIAEVSVAHYPRHEGEQSGADLRVIAGSFRDLYRLRQTIRSA